MKNVSFDHVFVFYSLIVGLSVTELLNSLALVIRERKKHEIRLYIPYTIWMINLFTFLLVDWWCSYYEHEEHFNGRQFFCYVVPPISIYLLCTLLRAEQETDGTFDFKKIFETNELPLFLISALIPMALGFSEKLHNTMQDNEVFEYIAGTSIAVGMFIFKLKLKRNPGILTPKATLILDIAAALAVLGLICCFPPLFLKK